MLVGPPQQLALAVNRLAPGVYQRFFAALGHAHRGIRVTPVNNYRSRAHNARVGGAANSQHLIATAMDFTYASVREREQARRSMQRLGLTVFDEGDHLHVQALPASTAIALIQRLRV